MSGRSSQDLTRRNRRMLLGVAGFACFMVGVSFAAVPLYDLFCRVTGYGGTTQQAEALPGEVLDREIVVRFDASISDDLNWKFIPARKEVRLKLGEMGLAFYKAHNLSGLRTAGTASFNVTPQKAGLYFSKIDCFCFTEQVLEPEQTVDMPVTFFVDPELARDPNTKEIKTLTLSYTFFATEIEDEIEAGDANASAPAATEGRADGVDIAKALGER